MWSETFEEKYKHFMTTTMLELSEGVLCPQSSADPTSRSGALFESVDSQLRFTIA